MKKIKFVKYQGNGNDFIILDNRVNSITKELFDKKLFDISELCDRNFGIGADGVIFIMKPDFDNDVKMIIYNSDNSEAEMCGNGIRCLIQYLNDNDSLNKKKNVYKVETKAGLKIGRINSDGITVKMGMPIFKSNLIPTTIDSLVNEIPSINFKSKGFNSIGYAVGMGNPHLVFFVDDINKISLNILGPLFENNKYFPDKTNVHFCEILNNKNIKVLVWERGVGTTLACGTGACAVHSVAYKLGLCENKTQIILPGGILLIDWKNSGEEILMTGNSKIVFNGSYIVN